MLGRAEGVVQFIVAAVAAQIVHLRDKGCDAYAARNQHVACGLAAQREQVAGRGDAEHIALGHLVVHEGGAALGRLLAAYADLVAAQLAWIAHQRIGIAELPCAIAHLHDDVAAAGEGRQRSAIKRLQREALDQRRRLLDAGNADL